MSNNNNEEVLPKTTADTEGGTPPARKRATKKTAAKKTATKKVAKKAVAKKAAAKKTAVKKVAKKAPAKIESSPELPFSEPVAKKIVAKKAPAPKPAPERTESAAPEPKRFGRVPGGGPVTSREGPADTPENPPREAAPSDREAGSPQRERQPNNDRNQRNRDGQPQETRSKRRRDKRKRRDRQGGSRQESGNRQESANRQESQRGNRGQERQEREERERRPVQLDGPKIEADGMLELAPKGFGFLRIPGKNFEQARDDVFVTPETIRRHNLRLGQWIHGLYQEGTRGPQLVEITSINGMTPEQASKLPHFDELKAINPNKRLSFETTPDRYTTRVVDIMAPVGRGQRGLIVSPPRSGKTTLLLHIAESIREKYEESMHLMVLLVDERPEEVTEFRRSLPGAEIYASSNDEQARDHCRIAELAIERAKRLVEAGKDVFILMDSITRLARAYNRNTNQRGRGTGSGGLTIGALEIPRRLFAAARNTRGGGSLTILATALIQTNSRADEAIYMEFKGTGNMELVLDRKIAENYIYPAVDIFKSGTRREELLLADHMLHKIHLIRRGLAGHRPAEAMERLLFFLKKFPNNPQMLLEIKG